MHSSRAHCYGNGYSNSSSQAINPYEVTFYTGWGAVFEYKMFSTPAAGTLGPSSPGLVRQYGRATHRSGYFVSGAQQQRALLFLGARSPLIRELHFRLALEVP